jgi:hypothetical protein
LPLRLLLQHFFKLRAEHVHLTIDRVTAERDACHAEVYGSP